jgi:hypothetical protein
MGGEETLWAEGVLESRYITSNLLRRSEAMGERKRSEHTR